VETENNTNHLKWNEYEGWPVDAYVVYRYAPGSDVGTELAELAPGFTTYEDIVSESPEEGQWRYRVQAFAMNSREESWSNYASANQETFIRMPNAFRPEGNTSYLFRPVYTNLTSNNYRFLIYNRWGQLIFESESPQAGWDGTFEGSYVQSGTYIYYISYEDNNGEIKSKKGSVLVIR
jgi:gliding motility-associated-like protein